MVPKGTFSSLGAAAGSWLGGPAGGVVGSRLGSTLARVVGFGSYRIGKNTLASGNANATFASTGHGCVICHREFIMDISGSKDFRNQSMLINVGSTQMFPWLSSMARNFEEYKLLGLIFEYKTMSGSISSSQALGTVVMATDYDSLDKPFATKQQMEAYEYSNSTVPSQDLVHMIECAPRTNVTERLYIANPPTDNPSEPLLYHRGLFQIAVTGCPTTDTIGELWVTYHVQLTKPRMYVSVSSTPDISSVMKLFGGYLTHSRSSSFYCAYDVDTKKWASTTISGDVISVSGAAVIDRTITFNNTLQTGQNFIALFSLQGYGTIDVNFQGDTYDGGVVFF